MLWPLLQAAPLAALFATIAISRDELVITAGEATAMTDQAHEDPHDLRNLVRIVSACTLGLWAFAAGLLIGVFLFS